MRPAAPDRVIVGNNASDGDVPLLVIAECSHRGEGHIGEDECQDHERLTELGMLQLQLDQHRLQLDQQTEESEISKAKILHDAMVVQEDTCCRYESIIQERLQNLTAHYEGVVLKLVEENEKLRVDSSSSVVEHLVASPPTVSALPLKVTEHVVKESSIRATQLLASKNAPSTTRTKKSKRNCPSGLARGCDGKHKHS